MSVSSYTRILFYAKPACCCKQQPPVCTCPSFNPIPTYCCTQHPSIVVNHTHLLAYLLLSKYSRTAVHNTHLLLQTATTHLHCRVFIQCSPTAVHNTHLLARVSFYILNPPNAVNNTHALAICPFFILHTRLLLHTTLADCCTQHPRNSPCPFSLSTRLLLYTTPTYLPSPFHPT